MSYEVWDKVIPLKKTSRTRDFDTCATYYARQELGQDFLYVTATDKKATRMYGEKCYWCNTVQSRCGGDSFRESDLQKHQE